MSEKKSAIEKKAEIEKKKKKKKKAASTKKTMCKNKSAKRKRTSETATKQKKSRTVDVDGGGGGGGDDSVEKDGQSDEIKEDVANVDDVNVDEDDNEHCESCGSTRNICHVTKRVQSKDVMQCWCKWCCASGLTDEKSTRDAKKCDCMSVVTRPDLHIRRLFMSAPKEGDLYWTEHPAWRSVVGSTPTFADDMLLMQRPCLIKLAVLTSLLGTVDNDSCFPMWGAHKGLYKHRIDWTVTHARIYQTSSAYVCSSGVSI
jgi:hypothetical protein